MIGRREKMISLPLVLNSVMLCCAIPVSADDRWLMDSGTSAYITHRREFFSAFQEMSEDSNFFLANHQGLAIKGTGTIKRKKFLNDE